MNCPKNCKAKAILRGEGRKSNEYEVIEIHCVLEEGHEGKHVAEVRQVGAPGLIVVRFE